MAAELVLHLRNDVGELERVATTLAAFGARHALAERDVFEVTLALDEVLTNVIWYAFDDEAVHDIVVRLWLDDGLLHVEVEDDGRSFDPLTVPSAAEELAQPVEERRVGGLGLHLVRRTMHALAYQRDMGRNRLTMSKHVAPRE